MDRTHVSGSSALAGRFFGYTAETHNSLDKKVVAAADKLIAKHTKNIEAYKAKIAKLEAELTKAEAVEVKTAA